MTGDDGLILPIGELDSLGCTFNSEKGLYMESDAFFFYCLVIG